MRFTLLGPLSVHDDEGPVDVAGKLRRTLLAALLLDAGTPVSAGRLAALLWGPDASSGTAAALHNHLMRLRQALGDENRVRAVPPGYLIDVEPGELDLRVFTEECAAGRRKLADKQWAEASRYFGAALELWRGRPLADIPALADDLRIQELEETHLQALQGRIEAELNLARHHELLDELRVLTGRHPRREAFRGQLMLALYRAGQPDEACAAYDEYEKSLLDELGLEPGADLRELHEAVVRRDPSLPLPPNPDAPRQLPADTRTFTGRAAELGELVAAAGESAGTLVVSALDGLGGIGKTALAVHAAHRVADRFRDGQLFIDLRGYSAGGAPMPAEEALAYLLRSLGVAPRAVPSGVDERAELYRTKLADSRTLIVLDNAADPEQVRPLLPGAPGCLVLITSRNRLAGLDGARALTLDIFGAAEAVELLVKAAGPARALGDSPVLRELAELCGYVPLALRIVAARLRHAGTLSVEDLLAELRDEGARLDRLTDGERDLTSLFETSFTHLPKPEQRALRLLGVLPGPDIDAYAAANLLGTEPDTAEGLLNSLLDRSLLIQYAEGRYGMHDLVRAYTRTLLAAEPDEADAARNRLLDYYQHTTWTAARHHTTAIRWRESVPGFAGPSCAPGDLASAISWLRTERAGLLAAAADSATAPARRIDLVLGLAPLMQLDGPWPEAMALQESAERAARALGDPHGRADALLNLGMLLLLAGPEGWAERSLEGYEFARELYRSTGNRPGEASVLFRTGRVLTNTGDYDAALVAERAALALFLEIGDRRGEALAHQAIGDTERIVGHNAEALASSRAALAIHQELGNRQAESTALHKVGFALLELGELNEAVAMFEPALTINREFGQQVDEGAVLLGLGSVELLRGSYGKAAEAFWRTLEIYEGLGYSIGVGMTCYDLCRLLIKTGEPLAAAEHVERARTIFSSIGYEVGAVSATCRLGVARMAAGDPEGRRLVEQALDAYRGTVVDPPGEIEALISLGRADEAAGNVRAALGHFEQALPTARRIQRAVDEAWILDGVSRCRALLGDREAALESLRTAVTLYRREGLAELADAEARLVALGG